MKQSEKEFTEWFEANEKRFSHGQFDEKQIAYSAWLQSKRQTAIGFAKSICKNIIINLFKKYDDVYWDNVVFKKEITNESIDKLIFEKLTQLYEECESR